MFENKTIIMGIINKGEIKSGEKCFLGPMNNGTFK